MMDMSVYKAPRKVKDLQRHDVPELGRNRFDASRISQLWLSSITSQLL